MSTTLFLDDAAAGTTAKVLLLVLLEEVSFLVCFAAASVDVADDDDDDDDETGVVGCDGGARIGIATGEDPSLCSNIGAVARFVPGDGGGVSDIEIQKRWGINSVHRVFDFSRYKIFEIVSRHHARFV